MPRGRTADALVVLLHGYGANGDDLIALADGWRERLPGAVFVAPNAPETIPGMPGSLQWFPLTLRDPTEYWRGVVAARPAVDRFLDAELARYRLAPEPPGAGRLQPGHHAGAACRTAASGGAGGDRRLLRPARRPRAPRPRRTRRPPILLIHGEVDDLIPVDVIHIAREQLAGAGHLVEWHIRERLGHGIDPVGQSMAGHFIACALRAAKSP